MHKRFLASIITIVLFLSFFPTPRVHASGSVTAASATYESAPTTIASGSCGSHATWTLDSTGTLTISGRGAMKNYSFSSAPWYSYHDWITAVVVEDGVTAIGEFAFYRFTALQSVTLSASVESVGSYAFYGCGSLSDATYGGDWDQLSIGEGNSRLTGAQG